MAVGEEIWVEAHLGDEIQHVRNIVTSVISIRDCVGRQLTDVDL